MVGLLAKHVVPNSFKVKLAPWRKQLQNFKTLCFEYGQYKSIKNWTSVDRTEKELPWYTYPCIEFLSQFDFSKSTIFEYGSGNSTVWWAARSKKIIAIENNKEWFDKVSKANGKMPNFDYRYCDVKEEYCDPSGIESASVVIIDGAERNLCADVLVNKLHKIENTCSMIVFDNSDWYPTTIELIRKKTNWVQCDFMGFGPINGYCWATTVFLNPKVQTPRKAAIAPMGGVTKIAFEDRVDGSHSFDAPVPLKAAN